MSGPNEKASSNLVYIGEVSSFSTVPEALDLLASAGLEPVSSLDPGDRRHVVAIVWGDRPFGVEQAAPYPALRLLARFGAGVDAVAVEDLRRRGVVVERTIGATTDTVAEFTLALIVAALRDLGSHIGGLRSDPPIWRAGERGRDFADSTVGIVGCGRIGLQTARLLDRLGVRLLGWNRTWPPDPVRGAIPERLVRVEDPTDLARGADAVSVHLALTPETEGLIGRRFFQAASGGGRRPVLVNTARGGVVDEEGLVEALDTGIVAAAAIDVWTDEGAGPGKPAVEALRRHPRVIPTPHVAARTFGGTRRCALACARRIVAALER